MLPCRVLSPSTAPTASTFGSSHHLPQLDVCHLALMARRSAQNASLCFQSLTHSSQFTMRPISSVLLTLRTLCEKHPGVGVSLANQFFDDSANSSRIRLFHTRPL